jgi:hypothetical protein
MVGDSYLSFETSHNTQFGLDKKCDKKVRSQNNPRGTVATLGWPNRPSQAKSRKIARKVTKKDIIFY